MKNSDPGPSQEQSSALKQAMKQLLSGNAGGGLLILQKAFPNEAAESYDEWDIKLGRIDSHGPPK